MKSGGFTIIELMIAISVLLIALASVSTVYISGERLMYSGISQTDVQRKVQTVSADITRWIMPASSVTILDNGDRIEMEVPEDYLGEDIRYAVIYYENGGLYYDKDINDDDPATLISNDVFETEDAIFEIDDDIVTANFGIESGYLHGPIYPVEVSIKIKIRNV